MIAQIAGQILVKDRDWQFRDGMEALHEAGEIDETVKVAPLPFEIGEGADNTFFLAAVDGADDNAGRWRVLFDRGRQIEHRNLNARIEQRTDERTPHPTATTDDGDAGAGGWAKTGEIDRGQLAHAFRGST